MKRLTTIKKGSPELIFALEVVETLGKAEGVALVPTHMTPAMLEAAVKGCSVTPNQARAGWMAILKAAQKD